MNFAYFVKSVSIGRRKPSWASKSWKRSSVKSNRSAASEPYGINNSADPYTDAVDSKNDAMDPNKLTPPKVNIQIIKVIYILDKARNMNW